MAASNRPRNARTKRHRPEKLAAFVLFCSGVLQHRAASSAAAAFSARSTVLHLAGRATATPRRCNRNAASLRTPLVARSLRGGGGHEASEPDDKTSANKNVPSGGAKADRLSLEGWIFMALLALQFGVQPSLVKAYTPQGIIKSSVVLVQEMVKFVIASGLYFGGTSKEQRKTDLSGMTIWKWIAIAGIPAALYNVQNIAALLAYQNLEPLTFNVLNQTKTLSAALCCYLVIGRKQSKMQMFSLILLLVSALIIEKVVTLSTLMPPFFGGGFFSGASLFPSDGSAALARHVSHGVFPILLASFISGLAGALVQKNLQGASKSGRKKKLPRNPYLFNMELNSASAILLVASLLFSADGKHIVRSGFFDQWTPKTFIPILTNSIGGIIVALVTKYAGSVRKGFALIFGILISGLIQAESGGITKEQVAGGLLAAASLYLHTVYPYKPKPKEEVKS